MTIKDAINGKSAKNPSDWTELQDEFQLLEEEREDAWNKGDVKKFCELHNKGGEFLRTDVGSRMNIVSNTRAEMESLLRAKGIIDERMYK